MITGTVAKFSFHSSFGRFQTRDLLDLHLFDPGKHECLNERLFSVRLSVRPLGWSFPDNRSLVFSDFLHGVR